MTSVYKVPMAAGVSDEGSLTPFELFAGSSQVRTDRATLLADQDLAQFAVVAFNSAGKLVAHDPTATTSKSVTGGGGGTITIPAPESQAVGILAHACDATGADTVCQYYTAGDFNADVLGWHASTDTLIERQAAFAGTPISVRKLI